MLLISIKKAVFSTNETVLLRDTDHKTSKGKSAAADSQQRGRVIFSKSLGMNMSKCSWNCVRSIVLATGHQVRYILQVQMSLFNKGFGFARGLNHLTVLYEEFSQPSLFLMLQISLNNVTVHDMLIIDYKLLNITTCSFLVFWNTGCTKYLV